MLFIHPDSLLMLVRTCRVILFLVPFPVPFSCNVMLVTLTSNRLVPPGFGLKMPQGSREPVMSSFPPCQAAGTAFEYATL